VAAGIERSLIDGAAGKIEVAAARPPNARGVAVIAHPHPLFGGTMENKVITTLAKVFGEAGIATFRFNFRGVGATEGAHDEGRGETDDMLRVAEHARASMRQAPLYLAGFSFGGAIATRVSARADPERTMPSRYSTRSTCGAASGRGRADGATRTRTGAGSPTTVHSPAGAGRAGS